MTDVCIEVAATEAALAPLQASLDAFCTDSAIPADVRFALELTLEELYTNVVHHGGSAQRATLRLWTDAGAVWLELRDDGPAFDPLALPTPDVHAELDDRPVGGLGVHLVRTLMDTVHYGHDGHWNCLTASKAIERR